MFCSDPTKEQLESEEDFYRKYTFSMEILMFILIMIGVVVVFGVHGQQSKPLSIKVLWALLCLIILARLARSLVVFIYDTDIHSFDSKQEREEWMANLDNYDEMVVLNNSLGCMSSNLTAVVHWIFAIAYFELALKCQLFIGEIDSSVIQQ